MCRNSNVLTMQGVIHYKCDATNNNAIASVLVLRQHVRREAVIIIILLVVTTTVKVLERFQQFKNACNSFVGRVFPNLQQKCYFYDNFGQVFEIAWSSYPFMCLFGHCPRIF